MILIDSREKKYKHIIEYFDANNIEYDYSKLFVGDFATANNQKICIDRKKDLIEVSQNLCQQHARFKRECERAQKANIKLIILVEQVGVDNIEDVRNWINPRLVNWEFTNKAHQQGKMLYSKISDSPPINGEKLYKIMQTMTARYNIEWLFCSKENTGKRILELLEEQ